MWARLTLVSLELTQLKDGMHITSKNVFRMLFKEQ